MRAVPPGPRSTRQVLAWWERRRIGYNAFVVVFLAGGIAVARLLASARDRPAATLGPADMLLMGLLFANVMYTLVWYSEIRYGRRPEGPGRSGLTDPIPIAARANAGVHLAMEVMLIGSAGLAFLLPIWFVVAA
ncbi:MAG TPA: hypothetical protein VGM82_19370 [Gemmatimonadaceae bacterium]|jgi:hypothetical protein